MHALCRSSSQTPRGPSRGTKRGGDLPDSVPQGKQKQSPSAQGMDSSSEGNGPEREQPTKSTEANEKKPWHIDGLEKILGNSQPAILTPFNYHVQLLESEITSGEQFDTRKILCGRRPSPDLDLKLIKHWLHAGGLWRTPRPDGPLAPSIDGLSLLLVVSQGRKANRQKKKKTTINILSSVMIEPYRIIIA